jgi:replicative DNA helicase
MSFPLAISPSVKQPGLALLVVDYLQLLTPTERRDNRQVEVSEMSAGLKRLARDLGVPVLALAQLNRGVETRGDKRPMLSDLRESGAIEQDADIVLGLYRDEYYHPDTTKTPGVLEVIVLKQRNGATGSVDVAYKPATGELLNMETASAISSSVQVMQGTGMPVPGGSGGHPSRPRRAAVLPRQGPP